MRHGRAEALRAALAERLPGDATLRRAYADLRETCAFALDPRNADRDLARLIDRYLDADAADTPVGPRFEAVLAGLPAAGVCEKAAAYDPSRPPSPLETLERGGDLPDLSPRPSSPRGEGNCWVDGVATLLRERLGLEIGRVAAFDPWAGEGGLVAALGARKAYGNEADPVRYARLAKAVGRGAVLADSLRLPERRPTPGFDFHDDENAARIADESATEFSTVVSDLRGQKGFEARVRWMAGRLAPEGVVAFLADAPWVDEPSFAGFRAWLAGEFGLVAHLALPEGAGVSLLVRGGNGRTILYAEAESMPDGWAAVGWRTLDPTPAHVWRTEILREEWATFLPLAGERGAIFAESSLGSPDGADASVAVLKSRRVLQGPFAPAWRTLDRRARREPAPVEGPTIVLMAEPFGLLAADAPVDRRLGARAVGGRVAAEAMRRFRAAYGAAVTERDAFDATLALLHHPEYRARYHEDLRRSTARLPLPDAEALAPLLDAPGAPPVGPGTAFRTGWLAADLFEPGTVPDFDDPFASPYARADVEPAFLLLVGLGAAFYRIQVDFERLRPFPLRADGEPGPVERMRLAADRMGLVLRPGWTLDGIPAEALAWPFGKRSAPEWVVESFRTRKGFDPNRPDDPGRPARLFAQAVVVGLETRRLAEIVGRISSP